MLYFNISLDFFLAVLAGLIFHAIAPAVAVGVLFIVLTIGILYTWFTYLPKDKFLESVEITNSLVGFCLSQYQITSDLGVVGMIARIILRLGGYLLALNPTTLIIGVIIVGLSYLFYVSDEEGEMEL